MYEQIGPDSPFGQQMRRNLEARGAPLYGLAETPTLAAHEARLARCGFERTGAADLKRVYERHLDPAERRRVEGLEMFDEFEEWHLIMAHYAIAFGVRDASGSGMFSGFGFPEFASADGDGRGGDGSDGSALAARALDGRPRPPGWPPGGRALPNAD